MEDKRMQYIVFLLLAALLLGGGYYFASFGEEPAPVVIPGVEKDQAPAKENAAAGEIKVHVGGAVAFPGVYNVTADARVEEALKMASPLLEADLDSISLAKRLEDGETIIVPSNENNSATTGANPGTINDVFEKTGKININKASPQELEKLPGVGSTIAARIVLYREENGPFRTVEDLANVSGIGTKKLTAVREMVTVR